MISPVSIRTMVTERPITGSVFFGGELYVPQHWTADRYVHPVGGAESLAFAARAHDVPLPADDVALPFWPPGRMATPMSRAPPPSPGSMKRVVMAGVADCEPKSW